MSEILLINEVARKMGISVQWARKIAEEQGEEMGAFRLSEFGHWRFRREVFERWFRGQGTKALEVDYRSKQVSVKGSGSKRKAAI